jgi:sugar phosphate isomerase/epimerase
MSSQLTMLNSMAGSDFEQALDRHLEWGLTVLDLKDAIYGKTVDDLLPQEAERAAKAIATRGMTVETLSTGIFYADIEQGEAAFRTKFKDKLARILESAPILQPRNLRLLSATSSKRAEFADSADYISQHHAWLIPLYREAIEQIHSAGFQVVIENEVHNVIFSTPQEIVDVFRLLDCGDKVRLTWDISNLWEEGTFPSLEVYAQLKPLIGLVHLKGGRRSEGQRLASSLEDAGWPVKEIVSAVLRDGVSPVICINPSHGSKNPAYNHTLADYQRDILYLRREFEGIE